MGVRQPGSEIGSTTGYVSDTTFLCLLCEKVNEMVHTNDTGDALVQNSA